MKESQIQRACLDLLEALRINGSAVLATRTNAGKILSADGYWIHLCREGWPDITAVIDGRFVGIETKALKRGRQSKAQKEMQEKIEAAGGVYLYVNKLAVLREFLGVNNESTTA